MYSSYIIIAIGHALTNTLCILCIACPAGTYLSLSNNSCSTCPANSISEEEGLTQCTCADGYYWELHKKKRIYLALVYKNLDLSVSHYNSYI